MSSISKKYDISLIRKNKSNQKPKNNKLMICFPKTSNLPFDRLPPNRYNPKLDYIKPRDNKGGYISRVERKPETVIGSQSNGRYIGIHRFYDLSRNEKRCGKYKYTFATNLRSHKPTSRFMIKDPSICYHNPKEPGPANYFPKNYAIEGNISHKQKIKKPLIYKFLPNSIVPCKDFYLDKNIKGITPGPGRYNAVSIIAQPIKNCIYDPEMSYRIEMEKIKKFRHLPYKNINNMNFCEDTRIRCIPGHGHTYRFRKSEKVEEFETKTKQALETKEGAITESKQSESKKDKSIKTVTGLPFYLSQIERRKFFDPKRKTFSIRSMEEINSLTKPICIHFNDSTKTFLRVKAKPNAKIAFMSTVPRWPDDETALTYKKQKQNEKLKKKMNAKVNNAKFDYSKISSRLNQIPHRYRDMPKIPFASTESKSKDRFLPIIKIGDYGEGLLNMYTTQSELNDFFKK